MPDEQNFFDDDLFPPESSDGDSGPETPSESTDPAAFFWDDTPAADEAPTDEFGNWTDPDTETPDETALTDEDESAATFDWESTVDAGSISGQPAGEVPPGLTGALPWHEAIIPSENPDAAIGFEDEKPGDDLLGDQIVAEEFQAEISSEPASPEKTPTLRDRLLALSPVEPEIEELTGTDLAEPDWITDFDDQAEPETPGVVAALDSPAAPPPDMLADLRDEQIAFDASTEDESLTDEVPDWFQETDLPQPDLSEFDLPQPEHSDWDTAFDTSAESETSDAASEDFIERFDPPSLDQLSTPPDDDVPDWLREVSPTAPDAAALPFHEGDLTTIFEDSALPEMPDLISLDEEMDWLDDISADDLPPTTLTETPPVPDEPEDVVVADSRELHTAPLDSSAIDDLLDLYDEDSEPVLADDAVPETGEEPATLFDSPEAEVILPVIDEMPDLATMFDAAGLDDVLTAADGITPAKAIESEIVDLEPAPTSLPAVEPMFGERPPSHHKKRRKKDRKKAKDKAESAPEQSPVAVQPGWLAEMRPSDLPVTVKAGGAEKSVTQKQIVELPDPLRVFHEATMHEIVTPEPLEAADSGPLAGISGALPLADIMLTQDVTTRPVEGLIITPEQQKKVAQLQALLAAAEEEIEEAVESDEFKDFDLDELDPDAEPTPETVPQRVRRPRRLKPDRVLVALVLLVGLIAPFITDMLHFATEPPALDNARQNVADTVATAATGQYVLVAFEYGPTAAGELDVLATAVIRDALAQGMIPLTLSTNPAGALHAEAVLQSLTQDAALLNVRGTGETALLPGEDYHVLRFLSGEAIGVRALHNTSAEDDELHPAFKTDLRGEPTRLAIQSLEQDIAMIIVIGESSDVVRTWAEQLEGVSIPKIALVTAAIEPLIVPYVEAEAYAGYLAGVRDAYSYNTARNALSRETYTLPDDVPVELPHPDEAQWQSMALGATLAAALIALGMVLNMLRMLVRRRRR